MSNISGQNSNAIHCRAHPDLFTITLKQVVFYQFQAHILYATTLHLNAFNVTGLLLSLVNTSPPLASVANVPAMIVAEVS
jgi:hypothetical protein